MKLFNLDIKITNTAKVRDKKILSLTEQVKQLQKELKNINSDFLNAKLSAKELDNITQGNGGIMGMQATNNVYQTYYKVWKPQEFQTAIMQATRTDKLIPVWYPLFNIFNNMMLDSHIVACYKTIYTYLSSQRYSVSVGDTVDFEATEFIQKSWFIDLCQYVTLSSLYGFNLLQVNSYDPSTENLNVGIVNPFFVRPDLNGIVHDPYDPQVTLFKNKPAVWTKAPLSSFTSFIYFSRLGELAKLFKMYIFKQRAISAWSSYMERYGVPPLIIEVPDMDKNTINHIIQSVEKYNSDKVMITPKNVSVQIGTLGAGTGNENIFMKVIDYANKEISKTLLGSTMVLEEGSSLSQSAVHERNTNKFVRDVRNKLIAICNEDLFPKLTALGCPIPSGARLVEEKINDLSEDTKGNAILAILNNPAYKIDTDEIERITGIHVEENQSYNDTPETDEYDDILENININ